MRDDLVSGSSAWVAYALGSALFGGATAILAKLGIKGVPDNLIVAIRTTVVLVFAYLLVAITRQGGAITGLSRQNWTFLTLSGLATGLSWLCYYRALQLGPASRVAPIDKLSIVIPIVLGIILFREKLTWPLILGGSLILAGVAVIALNPNK